MAPFTIVLIWTLSQLLSWYIAKKRNAKVTYSHKLMSLLLGPLLLPFVFILRPQTTR